MGDVESYSNGRVIGFTEVEGCKFSKEFCISGSRCGLLPRRCTLEERYIVPPFDKYLLARFKQSGVNFTSMLNESHGGVSFVPRAYLLDL